MILRPTLRRPSIASILLATLSLVMIAAANAAHSILRGNQ